MANPKSNFPLPKRIPLDRENINTMLALASHVGGYLVHVENGANGESVAYLYRRGHGPRNAAAEPRPVPRLRLVTN